MSTRRNVRVRVRTATRRHRPRVEALEGRALLSTIIVDTALDENDPTDGTLSLREAIEVSNGTLPVSSLSAAEQSLVIGALAFPSPNTIVFSIPSGQPTVVTLASALPVITAPVSITGYTQSGAAANPPEQPDVDLAALPVRLNGYALSQATVGTVDGLDVTAPNCTISGLNITGFSGAAVSISGAGSQGNWLYGNIIGTRPDSLNGRDFSTDPTLSNGVGLLITSSNNRAGGNNPGLRNVIANNGVGVQIQTAGGTGNLIQNNFILSNAREGVYVASSNNTIGEALKGGGNVISGNGAEGVLITGGPDVQGNGLFGNEIGTDLGIKGGVRPRGLDPLPNLKQGVLIQDSPRNVIGGASDAAKNVIAANLGDGLAILGPAAVGNQILGDWVGFNIVNSLESLFIPNRNGIYVTSSGNVIGGLNSASANTVANNRLNGILLSGAGAFGNVIEGNVIGLNPDGGSAFGNAFDGIHLDNAPNNIIGGTASGAGNTVSSNNNGVVLVGNGATGNLIQGNLIGTGVDGKTDLGNAVDGVILLNAPNNTVGGSVSGAGNVVSGNNRGVHVSGSGARDDTIQANFIGTDRTGLVLTLHNEIDGVLIDGTASFNLVGGTAAGTGNVITTNVGSGVRVDSGSSNAVRGNSIFANHVRGIDLNALNSANGNPAVPNIATVLPNGSTTHVEGSLDAAPLTTYALDFFASVAKDPSGFGQGQVYLASFSVTTDAAGHADYAHNLPVPVPAGQFVTATATDPNNNTSQFSNAVPAVAVQLSIASAVYSANETDPSVTVTVVRSGGLGGNVAVDYATGGGTAVAGVDYTGVNGTLFFRPSDFPPGAPQVITFTVPILNPNKIGGSVAFNVNLSNPANGATLGAVPTAVVTVTDNAQPVLSLGSAAYSVPENAGPLLITVTRNSGAGTSTVDYATADGTAVAGVNYTNTHGTLTFAPGVTRQTVSVPVLPDHLVRGPLGFTLVLADATGGVLLAPTTAAVTVVDTDVPGAIGVGLNFLNAAPGAAAASVVVSRTGGSAGTVTVAYATSGGNARPGVDYTPVSGTLTFAPGQVSKTIAVPLLNNAVPGSDSAFALTLSGAGGGASIRSGAGVTVVIVRHPAAPPNPADLVPPVVVDTQVFASPSGVVALSGTFSKPSRANNPNNYGSFATGPGPDGVLGTYDDAYDAIAGVAYDPGLRRSILVFATPLPFGVFSQVVLSAPATPGTVRGLTDLAGNLLDGTGTGTHAGTPYVATFAASSKLTYADAAGDAVTLSLTGPGLLTMNRGPDGNARSVRVVGAAPGATALTGKVVRPNRFVTVPVFIPAINGAAGVKIQLKAPFVVGGVSASAVDALSGSGLPSGRKGLKAWAR